MVAVLFEDGDKELAEAYLNAGHPDLDRAARRWVRRHGFAVKKGPGAHFAGWGAMR